MQGKVHVAIGVASVACLCVKYPGGFELFDVNILPAVSLFTAAAGSYAPDIDMQTTHAGRKHKIASKVVSKVGGGHRGITHTLLFPAIIAYLMYFTKGYLAEYNNLASILLSLLFGFEAGWCMHIFADMFNGKGVPLLWPIVRNKISLMDLPSSGVGGWLFAIVFVGLMAVLTFGGMFG